MTTCKNTVDNINKQYNDFEPIDRLHAYRHKNTVVGNFPNYCQAVYNYLYPLLLTIHDTFINHIDCPPTFTEFLWNGIKCELIINTIITNQRLVTKLRSPNINRRLYFKNKGANIKSYFSTVAYTGTTATDIIYRVEIRSECLHLLLPTKFNMPFVAKALQIGYCIEQKEYRKILILILNHFNAPFPYIKEPVVEML